VTPLTVFNWEQVASSTGPVYDPGDSPPGTPRGFEEAELLEAATKKPPADAENTAAEVALMQTTA
jgi:hypothetical protein